MLNVRTILPFQTNTHTHAPLAEHKLQASSNTPECMVISEKQFLRSHTMYSAISSWLFAIAGATNIGVLCAFSAKVLTAVEQGKPLFKSHDPAIIPVMGNKKYNRIALAMMAFGGACMAVSNFLESKKVVTEWQLGAGKMQRKMNIAERERAQMAPIDSALNNVPVAQASATDSSAPQSQSKNWVASVQPTPDAIGRSADR